MVSLGVGGVDMRRLHAIATAYACEPGKGSEPGIGWNIVRQLAAYHDLTVITRSNNRASIEAELERNPVPGLSFEYYDPPRWATWWKKGTRGLFAYYYWWQYGAYRRARRLFKEADADLVHHVTFGRYWSPSFLYRLNAPTVWGPVGGGESTPASLMKTLPLKGRVYEHLRSALRAVGEMDPFVRAMARKSHSVLATTDESRARLHSLGARNISVLGNAALDAGEITRLSEIPVRSESEVVYASIGRLLHWKGFHMGLEAFARANVPDSRYVVIGSGPAEEHLKTLAAKLGIADRVRFTGSLSRAETLTELAGIDVLVHPSLHDSGGWVCIEAMSAGRPVISLDLGGPSLMVTAETGAKVRPSSPDETLDELAFAMSALGDKESRTRLSANARRRAASDFTWQFKARQIAAEYTRIAGGELPHETEKIDDRKLEALTA